MTPDDAARAQSRLLALLAHLVLDGLTEDARPVVQQIPSLERHLPPGSQDDWDAEHQRFFGHELLPWASALLSPDVHLGGPIATDMTLRYRQGGFHPPEGHEPDHLGIELMYLAWLCEHRQHAEAARFSGEHLRSWLIPLTCAGHDAGGFFAEVLDLALHLIQELADAPDEIPLDIPDVLADDNTGLKQVGRWLATPTWSGILWTRSAVSQIARDTGVAHGFGSRRDVLESTLFAASDAGKLPLLTQNMHGVIERWLDRMQRPGSASWRQRLQGTSRLLRRLEDAARSV